MAKLTRRTPTPESSARRAAIGEAIRRARGGLRQAELGERLGEYLNGPVPQTTISRWELGETEITLEQARAVELALELEPGFLARAAGYT